LLFNEINYRALDQEKTVFYFHFFEINTCTFPNDPEHFLKIKKRKKIPKNENKTPFSPDPKLCS
jgi:hypothetical protein